MHAANDDLEAAADRLLAAAATPPPAEESPAPTAPEPSPDPAEPSDSVAPESEKTPLIDPEVLRFLRSKPARWAVRELDALGRWIPTIDGSASPLRAERSSADGTSWQGPIRDGRPDVIDRASPEFSRAVGALRVLEQVDSRPLAILWFAFVATGAETRDAYERGEVRIHIGDWTYDTKPPGGWLGRVALVAASDAERARLLAERSHCLREVMLRARGAHLLAEALRAYVAARGAPLVWGRRINTARAREGVERIGLDVDRAVVACTRARAKAPAPRRPHPRAQQRRAAA